MERKRQLHKHSGNIIVKRMANASKAPFNVSPLGSKSRDLKNESWSELESNFPERHCGYNILDGVCL